MVTLFLQLPFPSSTVLSGTQVRVLPPTNGCKPNIKILGSEIVRHLVVFDRGVKITQYLGRFWSVDMDDRKDGKSETIPPPTHACACMS